MLILDVLPMEKILFVGHVVEVLLMSWVLGMEQLCHHLHLPLFLPLFRLLASSGLPVDNWD